MVYNSVPAWYDRVVTHRGCTTVYHGVYHGTLWCTMVYRGLPWYTMVHHGIPRIPWYTMVYHGCTMVYHGFTMYTIRERTNH